MITRMLAACLILFMPVWQSTQAQDKLDDEQYRRSMLDGLYSVLSRSTSELEAQQVEHIIWSIWLRSGNEEVDAIIDELLDARSEQEYETALELTNRIIELKPDYAEGWNQRATVEFLLGDYQGSLDDIVETLKREPHHFGALSGRAYIQLKQGKNREAIQTINAALEIHPFLGLRHIIPNIKESQPL